LVHSPSWYASLDIPNLHTEQTILHILQVLCLPDVEDITAFLLHTCSKSTRLKLGWVGKLFDAPTSLQQAVTPLWLKHIWLTTQSLDIRIHTGLVCPPPCQGDIEIMRLFLQQGFHDMDTLLLLNCCRMYLHAFWVLDLCNGTGDSLVSRSEEDHTPLQTPWQWPKAIAPSQLDWHTWQIALTASLHFSQDKRLANSLGPWLQAPTYPGWYYEPDTDRLWRIDSTQWTFFIPLPQHTC